MQCFSCANQSRWLPAGHFMERLAHDMRSSLASIQGYAEVLVDYHVGVEGASLQTYGKIIVGQTYRLAKMIEDAVTSTCISGNQLRLEFEPVRPGTLLAALIDEARKKDVREIRYLDELGDVLIAGDTFRLREMLSKLIDNALSLSTSYVSIHALVENDQAGNWVEINVEDHGNGLTESEMNVLFHPFEPVKDHKTSPIFLSGLSFYIIQAIVEGHKGKLTVKSQPGQGTTYLLLLPIQKVKE
jgi:signal transduction histidine kinase